MPLRRVAPVVAVVLLASCTGSSARDDDDEPVDRVSNAAVVTAAIREVVDIPPPADDDGDDEGAPDDSEVDAAKPVVYVFSVAEAGLAAETQSHVFSAVRDDVDVRFADNRDEAIAEGGEDAAVIDGGVLLVIGEIPPAGELVDVAIEIYYDADNRTKAVFTFVAGDEETWTVTETSLVSLDAAA